MAAAQKPDRWQPEAIETVETDVLGSSTHKAPLGPLSRYVLVIAGATLVCLVGLSGRYGYHRDELYYLQAGRHLAWGYPDQPPFTPLLARLMQSLAPDSLMVLRLPSALAAAGVIVLTGLLAREFGASRSSQVLAALSMAVSGLLLAAGHLLSTTSFNLLFWTLLLWLVVRVLRTQDQRLWIVIGLVAGVGLLNSDLVAFLLAALLAGVLLCGPRQVITSRSLWIGGVIAAILWTPYLVWQAQHGWPELAVSRSIAAGGSGSSTPRYLVIPEQLALVSPYLCPVWIAGLIRLFRDPALRWCRSIAVAYVVLAIVFVATGGKAYYLASYLPALLAAGSQPTIDWLGRGRITVRRGLLVFAFAFTALGTVFFTLPVLPVKVVHDTPVVALNYDEGETIGWPIFVSQIASVYDRIPISERSTMSILASNYGEAGAVDRFGPSLGLPQAFSGQDGFWYWGPPPSTARTFIVIGFTREKLASSFGTCELGAKLNNEVGVDNQEQRTPIWTCSQLRSDWAVLWPHWKIPG
jgi:hypothetical protein